MKPEVELYDTTLRDGSQGEGVNFSVMDKLRIAEKLDAFGIHYIEGGWPGSNVKDMEFFELARRRRFSNAKLAAFSMTRRKGVPVERDGCRARGDSDVVLAMVVLETGRDAAPGAACAAGQENR